MPHRLPALRSAGRRARPSGLPTQAAPPPGLGGVTASQALHPDVPRALRAASQSPAGPARDPGAAAAPAPRRISLARLGQECDVATPRKLGEFRSLARPKLAPRAGDTSGRLRTPRLLAGGLCQRPPAPPLEPRGRRPAPGPPSASPFVAPPASPCGARTSLRRPHQPAAWVGRYQGRGWVAA